MLCHSCGFENPDSVRFCGSCATPAANRCPSCGFDNPTRFRFCGECAAPLEADAAAPADREQRDVSIPGVPSSFANGRYVVRHLMGEGGKKRVYLAHDTVLDRDVAFAQIKSESLNSLSRSRIMREAQAMGSLGSHPYIVTVFDLGHHEGHPYMVTELMGGGDVEGLIGVAPEHRLPLRQAIEIAQAVCHGLTYAHSKGIIHRDLKPGNILLTADGRAKIGDFGLAVIIDRSRLTEEGMMVGTVSYIPPEQAQGGEVSPSADLYSLGALLYEMVTGKTPFFGDDALSIIRQHINDAPPPPTRHAPDCPQPLEDLILGLLAKEPSARPASAADALAALDMVKGAMASEDGRPILVEESAPDEPGSSVFVGREAELTELSELLDETISGRGRLAMVSGEAGIGKTRLAQEFAAAAESRGARVLWGGCHVGRGASPYSPWVDILSSYIFERDADELSAEMGEGAAAMSELVPALRERLPELTCVPRPDDPAQARLWLFDSIAVFVKNATRVKPLVAILEDLHRAGPSSLQLLEFLAQEAPDSRLMIVATYRDEEVSHRKPLSKTLVELARARRLRLVALQGLSREDVGLLVEEATRLSPPDNALTSIYSRSRGNPMFVAEMVSLLARDGELSPERSSRHNTIWQGAGGDWGVKLPEGLREALSIRLDQLTRPCGDLLTVASTIGTSFSRDVVEQLLPDLSEQGLSDVIEEAVAAGILQPEVLPQGYSFANEVVRETIISETSLTDRVRLHARIAQTLEKTRSGVGDDASELAYHHGRADALLGESQLVHYSLAAGEWAMGVYAYEEALGHFETGLRAKGYPGIAEEESPDDAETAALLFGLGRALASVGPNDVAPDAAQALARAYDIYEKSGDVGRALTVAQCPLPRPVRRRSMQLLERASELASKNPAEEGRLSLVHAQAIAELSRDHDAAKTKLERSLEIARTSGDKGLEVRAMATAAELDGRSLKVGASLESSLGAIEIDGGDSEPHAQWLANLWSAHSFITLGDLDSAQRHVSACTAIAERLRTRSQLLDSLWANALLSHVKGDWQKARGLSDRCLPLMEHRGRHLGLRALIEFESGEFTQAHAYLDLLLDVMALTPPGHGEEYSYPAIVVPMAARVTGDTSQLDIARSAAETVLSVPQPEPLSAIQARAGLALIAVESCEADEAATQYGALETYRGTLLFTTGLSVDRLLGLLCGTMGRYNDASSHFEEALSFCRKAGYGPELARTCCDYADLLLERDGTGSNGLTDREKAHSLLDESLAVSRELGMRPLTERASRYRQNVKTQTQT